MAIEVIDLTEADIPGAIQVIQQAFADDPYYKWVFDASRLTRFSSVTRSGIRTRYTKRENTQFNKQRNYASLSARCHWGIKNALFQVAKDNSTPHSPVLGISCWLTPQPAQASWYSWTQSWILSFNQLYNNIRYLGRGGLRTNRYWIWKQNQKEAQAQIWDDDRGYYFCNIVAVHPEAQGKGIGGLLFKTVLDKADREGVKCYLESSKNVPNVQIYERMGFEMKREMECRDGDDACMLYCMVRDPRTG